MHFFNEWRVVSVQQKDLRVSAETIAHQWERELLLKKKVCSIACNLVYTCAARTMRELEHS